MYLSFPDVGSVFAKGGKSVYICFIFFMETNFSPPPPPNKESFGSIESVKATSDLYAPVDGEIVAVNKAIEETWSIVNTSPEDKGV